MTQRIFRSTCLVALAVLVSCVSLIMGALYSYFSNVQLAQLHMQTNLAAQGVAHEGMAYLRDLVLPYGQDFPKKGSPDFESANYRITWIGRDGTILYDSKADPAGMENHLEREEVQEALSNGYGESRRYSSTLLERSLYSAKALPDGTILRLSLSQYSVLTLLFGMAQPLCIVFAAAMILSVLLSMRVSKHLIKPFHEIDLEHPLANTGYDELAPFLRRIDGQQKQLRSQKATLLQKETELNTIMGCMKEGMILLNPKGKIISINHAARRLLDVRGDCIGADILSLSRNLDLLEILSDALKGQPAERVIGFFGEQYQISASPILSEQVPLGAALLFFNVTAREQGEQLRREFTANVSHELKTPLHSISGYAELLKYDLVKKEDHIPFAAKIYEETQGMIRLVEDIITLSHLDEGAKAMEREDADLYQLAGEAIKSLTPEAHAAHVTLRLSGMPAQLHGVRPLLYSIIYNLLDNAIKYTRENGKVTVTVESRAAEILLSVADTGIGIAPEHQERIFERFYRVDKSHSKEVGGTGLGLSIVKHAAKIHHATIQVESAVGEGTRITITFPAA